MVILISPASTAGLDQDSYYMPLNLFEINKIHGGIQQLHWKLISRIV